MSNGSEHMSQIPPNVARDIRDDINSLGMSDLEVIRQDVAELKAVVANLIALIEPLQSEIQPFMDKFLEGPIGKMLTGGK